MLPKHRAAGKVGAGQAVAGVAEGEQVVRIVAVRADVGQAVAGQGVIRRPAVFRLMPEISG